MPEKLRVNSLNTLKRTKSKLRVLFQGFKSGAREDWKALANGGPEWWQDAKIRAAIESGRDN